jgi:hypothetical protein
MTLATHAIAGAAIASLIPHHPVAAFFAGFASHFALDAIPHYDYPIYSEAIDTKKEFGTGRMSGALLSEALRHPSILFRDAVNFSFDASIGLLVSVLEFSYPTDDFTLLVTVLAGAIGGILPDPLQFFSKAFPYEPLASLQRFHKWIHSSWRLRETGHLWTGIVSQLLLIAVIISVAKLI